MRKASFILALILTIAALFLLVGGISAETQAQMRVRVANELIAKQSASVAACDASCLTNWRLGAAWLLPLATRSGLPLDLLTQANLAYTIEWGFSFERQFGRPPTVNDWIYGYADRAEAFRYLFDTPPDLFKVNEWATRRFYRLSKEYGGAW